MQFAKLKWNDQQPYSLDFDDVYYASDDGLAETEYVFIQHNQLKERFLNLQTTEFTIIETGFGTGLNFYCAAQYFLKHAPADSLLHFISIERYPLEPKDLITANQQWPMFNDIAKQLHQRYTTITDGLNSFHLCQNRIQLDVWIGDVSECLPKIETTADAWFLDGFAPSKNQTMWSASAIKEIARLSIINTTFATFTSAGHVRRELLTAGFAVSKAPGFGKKREMLYGRY
jgi:tRNA 5-methylaminomethyl-2-thiouridine biosynthesis bifunctional protein